jgi:hypothetical protein
MARNTKWNTPDWRDASAYPKELPLEGWFWEFTRRRADYRHDWELVGAPNNALTDEARWLSTGTAQPAKYRLIAFVNPRLPWSDRRVRGALHVHRVRQSRPSDPSAALPWVFDIDAPIKPQLKLAERALRLARQWRESVRPEMLKRPKRTQNKKRRGLWTRYLRALDARAAGAKFVDIGRELLNKQDYNDATAAGKQLHDAACAVRDNFPLP